MKKIFLLGVMFFLFLTGNVCVAGADTGSLFFEKKGCVTFGDVFSAPEGTIEFWFKPASKENNEWMLSISKDKDNRMDFGFGTTSLMYMVKTAGVWEYVTTEKAGIALDQWHHVACTFWPKKAALFVDGVLVAKKVTVDSFGLAHLKGGAFAIGRGSSENERYNGMIAEVRLSKSIRYAEDFAPVAAPFAPDENTVALWQFGEEGGEAVIDSSGHGFNGKIVGQVERGKEKPKLSIVIP